MRSGVIAIAHNDVVVPIAQGERRVDGQGRSHLDAIAAVAQENVNLREGMVEALRGRNVVERGLDPHASGLAPRWSQMTLLPSAVHLSRGPLAMISLAGGA